MRYRPVTARSPLRRPCDAPAVTDARTRIFGCRPHPSTRIPTAPGYLDDRDRIFGYKPCFSLAITVGQSSPSTASGNRRRAPLLGCFFFLIKSKSNTKGKKPSPMISQRQKLAPHPNIRIQALKAEAVTSWTHSGATDDDEPPANFLLRSA
jgi:hypothetical protein